MKPISCQNLGELIAVSIIEDCQCDAPPEVINDAIDSALYQKEWLILNYFIASIAVANLIQDAQLYSLTMQHMKDSAKKHGGIVFNVQEYERKFTQYANAALFGRQSDQGLALELSKSFCENIGKADNFQHVTYFSMLIAWQIEQGSLRFDYIAELRLTK
jgi:hypothetical protein